MKLQDLFEEPSQCGNYVNTNFIPTSHEDFIRNVLKENDITDTFIFDGGDLSDEQKINRGVKLLSKNKASLENAFKQIAKHRNLKFGNILFTNRYDTVKLTSVKQYPSIIESSCVFFKPDLKDFTGIHKHIKKVNGTISIASGSMVKNILGITKISGVTGLTINISQNAFDVSKLPPDFILYPSKAIEKIVNKCISKESSLIECQQELIDAGFDELANL